MSPIGDLARQDDYLPDVGPPLLPGGPQVSPGVGAVNAFMGRLLAPVPRPADSPIAYRTASPRVNITEQDIADATSNALAFSGGGLKLGEAKPGLFDYSRLHEVPAVPQIDIPRYAPPRGAPARTLELTSDPTVRSKMLETIAQGQQLGGANWYNAEPLRQAFNAELGSGGDAAFRRYMDMIAATSPRSDVGTNVRNASYYYGRAMRGEPMPALTEVNPQPYGHFAQKQHKLNAQAVVGTGWDPLQNPKPASFVENLVGNQAPVTVDTHALRLPAILAQDPRFLETAYQSAKDAPKQNIQQMVARGELPIGEAKPAHWQAQPRENEYAALEQYYKGLGRELGLTPAQTQASAWVGGGKLTGLASDESKPFLRFFEDRVNLTAEKRGETPAQTLKKFIRGKAPLLTVPPVMGALAAQDNYPPP
jgi:hypothetical protein